MPQLDKVTFLSQFFWLCLFYIGFYYLVLKYFLPKISRILTLRQKKMNLSQYGFHSLQQENQQVRQNLDTILYQGLSLSRNVFNNFLLHTTNWLDNSLTAVNKTQFKTINNSYIQSLGEASLSQNISFYQASSPSPESLIINRLFNNIRNLKKNAVSRSIMDKKPQVAKKTTIVQESTKKSKKNKKK
jgi:hypothetical protein